MKEKFCFGFRYEKMLAEKVRRQCKEERLSLNDLVHKMADFLADVYNEGRMDLFETSRFLSRPDTDDIMSTSLILSIENREMFRNLSYSYRISMAEVIRLGLEMYLEAHSQQRRLDKVIHTYRSHRHLIHTVIISLYPVLPEGKIPYPLLL